MSILDGLIAERIFMPHYEFRISLVGFNDDIFHEVALSEFNFAANRNATYARARFAGGLETLKGKRFSITQNLA